MLFLNVTAGILFISNAVPIMRELTGTSPETALAVYGFIALFNGLGRFFWGAVSDRIGRNAAYLLIYGSQAVIFFVVGGVHSLPVVAILFAIVLLDYGGGFGTMPSFTADYFGTKYMGVNYGWILLGLGRRRGGRADLRVGGEGRDRLLLRRPAGDRGDAARRGDPPHRHPPPRRDEGRRSIAGPTSSRGGERTRCRRGGGADRSPEGGSSDLAARA